MRDVGLPTKTSTKTQTNELIYIIKLKSWSHLEHEIACCAIL